MKIDLIYPNRPILGLDGATVGDFWSWAYSDALGNTNRSAFAEFLVGRSLGVTDLPRVSWDSVDLRYRGAGIEVKASAFIQSWSQKKPSINRFDISEKRPWDPDTNETGVVPARSARCYVFCLFTPKAKPAANVFDTSLWQFYVVARKLIDDKCKRQKSIGLATLERLARPVSFDSLKGEIDQLLSSNRGAASG